MQASHSNIEGGFICRPPTVILWGDLYAGLYSNIEGGFICRPSHSKIGSI